MYGSDIESLEQGSEAPITALNYGQMLGPLRSRQYEVGVKTEQARWSATAALFRIECGAEYTNSQGVYVQHVKPGNPRSVSLNAKIDF